MLKKQDLGINPHVAKNGSRDQSLTGMGGPRVYVDIQDQGGVEWGASTQDPAPRLDRAGPYYGGQGPESIHLMSDT